MPSVPLSDSATTRVPTPGVSAVPLLPPMTSVSMTPDASGPPPPTVSLPTNEELELAGVAPATPTRTETYLPAKRKRHAPRKRLPKNPKDSKVRKTVMAILALRAQGMTIVDAAEHLEMKVTTAYSYLYKANKQGWINLDSFADPEDQLEIVLKSNAVKNIKDLLIYGQYHETENPLGCVGDKETTLEVAKGLGMLKTHAVTKSTADVTMGVALKVDVVMPQVPVGAGIPTVRAGSVGGTPIFDAEILKPEED